MRDLFGEVAVSFREIQIWLFKVPRLPHDSSRRIAYVRQWNVHFKVARAKESGELAAIFGDESCEFCGQVLCAGPADTLPAVPSEELILLRRRVAVLEMVLRASSAQRERPACDRPPSPICAA